MSTNGDQSGRVGLRLVVELCALIVACSLGLFSLNLVMTVPFLLLAAVAIAPRYLAKVVHRIRARSGEVSAPRPGWHLPIILALAASWAGEYFLRVWLAEQKVAPVITAVERYRTAHGIYPRSLTEIGPGTFAGFERVVEYDRGIGFNDGSLFGIRGGQYSVFEDDRFTVGFMTCGFNHHHYDSRTKRWRNWD